MGNIVDLTGELQLMDDMMTKFGMVRRGNYYWRLDEDELRNAIDCQTPVEEKPVQEIELLYNKRKFANL